MNGIPEISRFYGIVIRMFFNDSEHNPPHLHASYGKSSAEIDIRTGKILKGMLPPRANSFVLEWLALHRDELLEIWETQEYKSIPPLE